MKIKNRRIFILLFSLYINHCFCLQLPYHLYHDFSKK